MGHTGGEFRELKVAWGRRAGSFGWLPAQSPLVAEPRGPLSAWLVPSK
jgi:hypothetical protein